MIGVLTLTPGGQAASLGNDTSVWQRVSCVTCPPTWLADILSNIMLFLPLGAALVMAGVAPVRAIMLGAAASFVIELLQLAGLPAGREPALADLVSNTIGAAIGVGCARYRSTLLTPIARTESMLRLGWVAACTSMMLGSALALSPATRLRTNGAVSTSALPFTPGYGWSTTETSDAIINGVAVPHEGNGPVIVAASRRDSVSASVRVRGRDGRAGVVPIVFVHDPAMTTIDPRATVAHLLLAQRGADASLSSDLRAGRWGLSTPSLLDRGAFAAGYAGVALRATVTSRIWTLAWSDADTPQQAQSVSLRLSPSIGWTLVQGVVSATAPIAPLLTALWLLAWFAPLGFWSSAGSRDPLTSAVSRAVLAALLILAFGFASAQLTGTSPLSFAESGWCVLATFVGSFARRFLDFGRPHASKALQQR